MTDPEKAVEEYTSHPGYQPSRREQRVLDLEAQVAELRKISESHGIRLNGATILLENQVDTNSKLSDRIIDANRYMGLLRASRDSHNVRLWCLFGMNFCTLVIIAALAAKADIW